MYKHIKFIKFIQIFKKSVKQNKYIILKILNVKIWGSGDLEQC